MDFELVIFDCDGVLVDSEAITNTAVAEAFKKYDVTITAEDSRSRFGGLSVPEVLELAQQMTTKSIPSNFFETLKHGIFESYRQELLSIPGALKAVETLSAQGIRTCVASNGSLEKMDVTLGVTGLPPLLEGRLYSADEVARGKPAPDLFLHVSRHMDVLPKRSVVIEDSTIGIIAALAAGMSAIQFGNDLGNQSAVIPSSPQFLGHAPDFDSVFRILGIRG